MNVRKGVAPAIAFVGILLVTIFIVAPPTQFVDPGEYERTTVTIVDENGTQLAAVDVRIADTQTKRRVGLMRTEDLETGSGMLFVHEQAGTHHYHMRNVDFHLDIVFIDANGTITSIHHASARGPNEESYRYSGRGKYVLEVNRGYTTAHDIDVGDRVQIPAEIS